MDLTVYRQTGHSLGAVLFGDHRRHSPADSSPARRRTTGQRRLSAHGANSRHPVLAAPSVLRYHRHVRPKPRTRPNQVIAEIEAMVEEGYVKIALIVETT